MPAAKPRLTREGIVDTYGNARAIDTARASWLSLSTTITSSSGLSCGSSDRKQRSRSSYPRKLTIRTEVDTWVCIVTKARNLCEHNRRPRRPRISDRPARFDTPPCRPTSSLKGIDEPDRFDDQPQAPEIV